MLPTALLAVMVQVTVCPADEPATPRLPFSALVADPVVQDTEPEVALPVVQLNALFISTVAEAAAKLYDGMVGSDCTLRVADPVETLPAAFVAVTVQVPLPVPLVVTAMLPDAPEPDPYAGAAQLTDADVALVLVQLKVEPAPVTTVAGENEAPVTRGAVTTVKLAEPVAGVPAGLYAVTVQVPVPVPLVVTLTLPAPPEPEPTAGPAHATEADEAFAVVQLKLLRLPELTIVGAKAAPVTLAGT